MYHSVHTTYHIQHTMSVPSCFVVTGAPCSGKTTTLKLLAKIYNVDIVSESATKLFEQSGLSPGEFFTQDSIYDIIATDQNEQYESINSNTITLCDRSIFDTSGYKDKDHPNKYVPCIDVTIENVKNSNTFNRVVFFMKMNMDYYDTNGVRHESQEEALNIEKCLRRSYTKHGFTIVNVEWDTVENRANFIMEIINKNC